MARPDRGGYPTSDDASRRWADPVQGCPLAQGQASRHSSPTNASLDAWAALTCSAKYFDKYFE